MIRFRSDRRSAVVSDVNLEVVQSGMFFLQNVVTCLNEKRIDAK